MLHDARFMTAQIAANDGAMGFNSMKEPSLKMLNAGNYKKGRLRFYGLEVAIENPAGTYRDTGKKWRLADHYGYIRGFKGADGDDVDCFVGSNVTSKKVYIINQSTADGITFDEHKIMIGYDTPQQAMLAYQLSYDQGWHGLSSIVEVSVKQLRFWLERGSKSKPVIKADLPSGGDYEIPETLVDLMWNGETPSKNIDGLLFAMRRTNAVGEYGNLLLDAATMEDLTAGAQLLPVFDALVSQFSRIKPKMETLQRAMAKKSELADPTADIQISDPFKRYGSLQVSVLFTLTDGQTVSVFFHNPDATPNKILPTDSMVSWKWMLNKKDVTIVVAPEMGKDVPVAEVANRVMQLAQKNAPAFAKSQENKGERVESIKALRAEISELEQKEVELKSEIATFKEINGNEVSSTPIQEQPEVVNTNSEQIQTVKDSDFESFKEDIKKRINSMNIIGVMSPLNKRQKQNHDKNIIKRAKDSDYLKALGISTQTFSQGMPTDNEFKKAFEQKKDFDAKGVKEDNYGQEYIKNKKDQDEELYAGVREIANQKDDTEERKNARKFLDHKGEGEDWDSEPIQPSVKKTSPVAPEPIVITGKEPEYVEDDEDQQGVNAFIAKAEAVLSKEKHVTDNHGEWGSSLDYGNNYISNLEAGSWGISRFDPSNENSDYAIFYSLGNGKLSGSYDANDAKAHIASLTSQDGDDMLDEHEIAERKEWLEKSSMLKPYVNNEIGQFYYSPSVKINNAYIHSVTEDRVKLKGVMNARGATEQMFIYDPNEFIESYMKSLEKNLKTNPKVLSDYFMRSIDKLREGTEEEYQANIDKLADDIERAGMMPQFDQLLKDLDNEKDTTIQKAQAALKNM